MTIPMEPITVKMPPSNIPIAKKQAGARGFEGLSDYVRALIEADGAVLHKQYLALESIFGAGTDSGNGNVVGLGNVEDSQ
jgi:hypothetical protein